MTNVNVEVKEISYGKYHGYVRTVDLDEKGVYVAGVDLAKILGYNQPRNAKKLISTENQITMNIQEISKDTWDSVAESQLPQLYGQRRPTTMISIAGINELLDKSGLPEVQELRQAIFSKVLPSIYTNGNYQDDGSVQNSIGGQIFKQTQNMEMSKLRRINKTTKKISDDSVRNAMKEAKEHGDNQFKGFPVQLRSTMSTISVTGHTPAALRDATGCDNPRDVLNDQALASLNIIDNAAIVNPSKGYTWDMSNLVEQSSAYSQINACKPRKKVIMKFVDETYEVQNVTIPLPFKEGVEVDMDIYRESFTSLDQWNKVNRIWNPNKRDEQ